MRIEHSKSVKLQLIASKRIVVYYYTPRLTLTSKEHGMEMLACPGPGEREGWHVQDLERGRVGMSRTWIANVMSCGLFMFSEFS
jgi:hypothetical protein